MKLDNYISGYAGNISVYIIDKGNATLYYTIADHLGSLTEITDQQGMLVQRMEYDAWGNRSLLTDNTGMGDYLFDRGYTGHEHLDAFKLINMNGRMYDPVVGRMLSPDPFIQDPSDNQNFNRYSYCLNNPMMYADPTGYYGGGSGGNSGGNGYYINGIPVSQYIFNAWYNINLLDPNNFALEGYGNVLSQYSINQREVKEYYSRYEMLQRFLSDPIMAQKLKEYNNLTNGSATLEPDPPYSALNNISVHPSFNASAYYVHGNHLPGNDDPPLQNNLGGNTNTTNTVPSLFNWTNTGANAAAYGAYKVGGTFRLMKSGSVSLGWYKSGWSTGNQYVKTTYSLSKLGKGIGYGTSFVGAAIGVINFELSDKSWGDYGQLGMSFLSSGLTCFPATTLVGIGLGAIDIIGGFNGFYNYLDENQHLYNNTGLIMIPSGIMGIPTFFKLK